MTHVFYWQVYLIRYGFCAMFDYNSNVFIANNSNCYRNCNACLANNLLKNFGCKYINSKDNKLLFEEFLHK